MIRRREFITLLAGTAAAWPLAAGAQQLDRMRRIGVLLAWTPDAPQSGPFLAAFAKALGELGWTEGRNIQIDYRWAGANANQI